MRGSLDFGKRWWYLTHITIEVVVAARADSIQTGKHFHRQEVVRIATPALVDGGLRSRVLHR